jgi:hypothetical protein
MVGLLALAHDRTCEAEMAIELQAILDAGEVPDLTTLQQRFTPASMAVPDVTVTMPAAMAYDLLLSAPAHAAGDAWSDKASNLLLFGPPGAGKSHCAARSDEVGLIPARCRPPIPIEVGRQFRLMSAGP